MQIYESDIFIIKCLVFSTANLPAGPKLQCYLPHPFITLSCLHHPASVLSTPVTVGPPQPWPHLERHAAPVGPDLQEEPAPWRGSPVEEERRGPRVQPPVWLRCAGCWGHGEDGQGLENCARAFPLCRRIHSGGPVSHISTGLLVHCISHGHISHIFCNYPMKMLKGQYWVIQ